MSLFYKRITLVVADIERSLTVYRDILGFTLNSLKPSDEDSYSYPVFRIPREAQISFATLDGPEQVRTIGLSKGIRMTASVIKVNDLVGVIAQIKELGLETTEPETDRNDEITFLEQAFIDFDGHLIVLYEIIEM